MIPLWQKVKMRSKEERFTQCHRCGKTCYNRGYVVTHCSQACKEETQASRVKVITEPCVMCGKVVTRKRYASDTRNVKSCCCSLACQKQWAMVANRGLGNQIDWVARSKKAKAKYYKEASRKRYEKSEYKDWKDAVIKARNKKQTQQKDGWKTRCYSALQCLKIRLEPAVLQDKTDCRQWSLLVRDEQIRIREKAKRGGYSLWKKKVATVTCGMKHRRKRLQGRKSI